MRRSEALGVAGAVGRLLIGVGVARLLTGIGAWYTVRAQLTAEHIVIPGSATLMAGRTVRGPMGAFAEAEFIRKATLKTTGGKTYGDLEENDPNAHFAMEASLIRSSLMTSVLAFGMAAAETALGVVLVATGSALIDLDRRRP